MSLDRLSECIYRDRFEIRYLKCKATSFQDLFSEIMERAYPGEFIRVKPWGNSGDEKSDGYFASGRQLFQVYAPATWKSGKAMGKIRDDFEGAKSLWAGRFDTWVFVHNADEGLPPKVAKLLAEMHDNPPPQVTWWTKSNLENIMLSLARRDLESIFGYIPDASINVSNRELKPILEFVASQEVAGLSGLDSLEPVPLGKIEFNRLTRPMQNKLEIGMIKSPLVKQFFDRFVDPQFGDTIADKYRAQYAYLRSKYDDPDKIFLELLQFTGEESPPVSGESVARYAVLAYFFERCDIFEAPFEGFQP